MAEKFRNKYRIKTSRLQNWDYGWNAAYFVTICTDNREYYFGDVIVETPNLGVSTITMQLSEIGEIAKKFWFEIPNHFPFVKLGAFVVMPNHVHGIVIIDKYDNISMDSRTDVAGGDYGNDDGRNVETPKLGVSNDETHETTEPDNANTTGGKNKKWNPGTLGVIINQYKRICTINARKIHSNFGWQSRFHDHIIRDNKAFQNITKYILNNPLDWQKDKFY